ncbi:MAG: PilZ domain-containing protein [Myxococcota bacterium]
MSAPFRPLRAVRASTRPLDENTDVEAEATELPKLRREERLDVVRRVEYSPYPRAQTSQGERIGFTRDLSSSGMCLRIDVPEPVGSLLRVSQSEIDGSTTRESIARVVWSAPTVDGGCWVGLAVIEPRRALRAGSISRVA